MNWENVRCFVAVAEGGSLTAGARRLDMSIATLARKVDALEAELGLKVLRRSPGGVRLSPEGARVLTLAQAGAEHLSQLERLAASLKAGLPDKPIRISATEPMIVEVLAPRLPELRRRAPAIRIGFSASTATVDLHRDEADLAIRLARPVGDSLVARRLPDIKLGLFASTGYLGDADPAAIDLQAQDLLMFDDSFGDIPEVRWLRDNDLERCVVLESSSTMALLNAASAGCGVAMLPVFLARRRGLIRVRGPRIPARSPWLVFHKDLRRAPMVKLVRDWVVDCCDKTIAA